MIMVNREKELVGIRGWLLVYVVVLGLLTVHAIGLTVASVIVYNKPAGRHSCATESIFTKLRAVLWHNKRAIDYTCSCVVYPDVQEEEGGDFA
jgi:hypothetical protein